MSHNKSTKWWIFAITSMANLSATFAMNSVNLALPIIAKEFGVSQGDVSWLTLIYSLIPCCMLLICGKMGICTDIKDNIWLDLVFSQYHPFWLQLFQKHFLSCSFSEHYRVLVIAS
ncbi:hypothetical protein [Aminipila terrae]|uniref:hypothetical protein n=1 Tax=Aminipila terrae TaxID=2697030 RepID=UPI001FAE6034|nr:hypothetical protein [Aminipila terrae]